MSNAAITNKRVAPEDVAAVSIRLERTFHTIVALHELCDDAISQSPQDPSTLFVALRELLRSVARDTENCAEILSGDECGLGYFESHFGRV
jgi:hypothetical protein